jgi:hypothetical protein
MSEFCTASKMGRHKESYKYAKNVQTQLVADEAFEKPAGPFDSIIGMAELGIARFKTPRAFQSTVRT